MPGRGALSRTCENTAKIKDTKFQVTSMYNFGNHAGWEAKD